MSTATLPDVEIDSDIESLVNSAFEELDCSSARKDVMPCGGELRGFQEMHDCYHGWLCAVHFEHAVQVLYPAWRKRVEESGRIHCSYCLNLFTNMKSFYRLTGK